MKQKILITGGAGFIGSHLVRRLVNNGYCVTVVDNLERGSLDNLMDVLDKIVFFQNDLREYNYVNSLFETNKFNIVIHLASKVGGIGVYTSKPYTILSNNVLIDTNVLRAAIAHKVPKYFYASSAHVYPKDMQNTTNSFLIFEDEAFPADCELSYGWAKLMGELQVQSAVEENLNFNAVVARFIGIYGTNQDYQLETGSVIPVFSHRAIKYPEIPFIVKGDGSETRTYCYIDDALDCIELMIEGMDKRRFITVNVGQEVRYSIKEIAEIIVNISGKNIDIKYDNTVNALIKGQKCSCTLAENIYGWRAKTSLENGIKIIYDDLKKKLTNG